MKKNHKKNVFIQLFAVLFTVCFMILTVSFVEQKGFEKKSNPIKAEGACPGGYLYVGGDDFCIEADLHDAGAESWEDAAMSCMMDDAARLCRASEWAAACKSLTMNNEGEQWEWVDDFADNNNAILVGETGCEDYAAREPFNSGILHEYRCCKNASL